MEHSLILYHKDQCIFENDEHWLYPLFALEDFLKGKSIPADELFLKDKIAGKAAASLMVKFGIKDCFIELLSERAIPVFERYNVRYSYGTLVDHIQCRTEDLITDRMTIDETYLFLRKRAGRVQGIQLKIDQLFVGYSEKSILSGLDLELNRGEQLIIQGENGSGKTTLLKAILGLITPDKGTITVGDWQVGNQDWSKNRTQTGYLPQDTVKNNFPISASEVVALGLSSFRISEKERDFKVELAMRKTGCFHLQNYLFRELSGGEKQRVSMARCLCQNSRLLLLDEPTSFLDEQGKEELAQLFQDLSNNEMPTMLLVSHDSTWIEGLGWPVKILKNGKLW